MLSTALCHKYNKDPAHSKKRIYVYYVLHNISTSHYAYNARITHVHSTLYVLLTLLLLYKKNFIVACITTNHVPFHYAYTDSTYPKNKSKQIGNITLLMAIVLHGMS